MNPINSIIRAATRKSDEPLNVLCAATHERKQESLAKTGHKFYMWQHPAFKKWALEYAPIPPNHILLDENKGEQQLPLDVNIDCCLAMNKAGQAQIFRQISRTLQVPLITYELTYPDTQMRLQLPQIKEMTEGHINVFLTEDSWRAWGDWKDGIIIEHGIDVDLFKPKGPRKKHLLTVVNDFIRRTNPCGFDTFQAATNGFPTRIVGNTPGLSQPAPSTAALVNEYASSQIYFNSSRESPIPTSMLEAMACGCAIVTTGTCQIPDVIKNGVNGFISNDINELRSYLSRCLSDVELCKRLGDAARETILTRYSVERFVTNWNAVFDKVRNFIHKG